MKLYKRRFAFAACTLTLALSLAACSAEEDTPEVEAEEEVVETEPDTQTEAPDSEEETATEDEAESDTADSSTEEDDADNSTEESTFSLDGEPGDPSEHFPAYQTHDMYHIQNETGEPYQLLEEEVQNAAVYIVDVNVGDSDVSHGLRRMEQDDFTAASIEENGDGSYTAVAEGTYYIETDPDSIDNNEHAPYDFTFTIHMSESVSGDRDSVARDLELLSVTINGQDIETQPAP